ncbi:putative gamma-glutamylcyclotransferase At3g02910 [Phragmites australis]|uniref:putative gamma-glutamylcyclotransferase At3g02910 n=1 Tax=Phragmites australis TaxID=29695 RepID=UPI002D78A626|nr:putative gamma-glutamylcyclotransferase At3g02910 [Phragmites australis]
MDRSPNCTAGDAAAEEHPQQPPKRTLVFTYGTLKRGFSNHALLQELARGGDASFVGAATTASRLPLVCGPYRVPFLLNLPGAGHRVAGELYAVTPRGLERLDELEGISRAHYERLPISVDLAEDARVDALAYYAHRAYADDLWRRSGEKGYPEYSHAVAAGYLRRKDRPQDVTFLEQIRIFVSSQS